MPDRRSRPRARRSDEKSDFRTSGVRDALVTARRAATRALARLPRSARLLWISLAVLGGYALAVHLHGIGLLSLVALPVTAALFDLLFQNFRFPSFRFPDAAIATGALLALLLPPTVSVVQAQAVAVMTVTLRHVLRFRERPLMNPAAVGVVVGAIVFGMAPSWWGSIDVWLVVLLGVIVTLRSPDSWRPATAFLVANALLSPLGNLVLGESLSPQVLLLGAADPSMLFFGLFMMSEPRTSPRDPTGAVVFGTSVGGATAFLPAIVPSLAPLIALLLGNFASVAARRLQARATSPEARERAARRERMKRQHDRRSAKRSPGKIGREWGVGHRLAAGFLVFALIGGVMLASQGPSATPSTAFRPGIEPRPGGGAAYDCSRDNSSISQSALTFLHDRLGPSVILSYNANSGLVVFYDPVNRATVTETDLYEDFGYAEFNGDDYARAGCS